jgi:alkylation response protein AidB-like acyl-CoA dehydrogenase
MSILDDIQQKGQLGCFALTEKFAGVNSGLVVDTEIEWNQERQIFILNTPSNGAKKNWISQGFTADKAVVIANLSVAGQQVGPHAFLMDFRDDNGQLVPNVEINDMGPKSVGNDLDNAWIHFDNVELPYSAMLNRFSEIDVEGDGEYRLRVPGVRPFDMIAQRLFTGRIAVAQAALAYRKSLYSNTKTYADSKLCWSPGKQSEEHLPSLSSIPQLTKIFSDEEDKFARISEFVSMCEDQLNHCLRMNEIPDRQLQEAIAVAKVRAVEESIDMCFRLKQEVGSFALMVGSGFDQMDFLQCCKFAEGDSRILMLKMARDCMSLHQKTGVTVEKEAESKEDKICQQLASLSTLDVSEEHKLMKQHLAMTELAHLNMDRIMESYVGPVKIK